MKSYLQQSFIVCLAALLGSGGAVRAQSTGPAVTNQPAVITVLATDPNASVNGSVPGTIEITRTGATNEPLTVLYSLGGTARNGRDYRLIPGYLTIPAGSSNADVTIRPIPPLRNPVDTNETVILQVHPWIDSRFGPPAPYTIGWPSNAVVNIAENATPRTNQPPVVKLVSPADGAGFIAPATIQLLAQALDPDGTVTNVEFFAGGNSLGNGTNRLTHEFYPDLVSLTVSNVLPGDYVITAMATDNHGATNTSPPITLHVISPASIPTVTVTASDAEASELGPDTGSFTLTRTGDTTGALAVYYSLGGTARNGVDYRSLPGVVNFAAGAPTTNITVVPLPDLDFLDRTNDTVALQLRPVMSTKPGVAGFYNLGSPSNAVVTITENSNAVSRVTIVATDASASEDGPDTATFQVTRTGGNTAEPLTVFYALGGSARNGQDYQPLPGYITIAAGDTVTNLTLTPILDVDTTHETNETVVVQVRPTIDYFGRASKATPYLLGWPSNAVATITESATAPKDFPPVVRLLTPQDGAGFVGPTNVTLIAQARDPDGTVTNVQFFAGTTSIGVVTNASGFGPYRGLYSLTWSNAALGQYVVTAQATDNAGLSSTSAPVNVVVTANALPVVNIFATDPVAYTGTNALGMTNTATFLVRRSGPTNADLVVYFKFTGSASNGVDFLKVPESITILAGSSSATFAVQPLMSGTSNRVQTVIATLQLASVPPGNPPTYLVGRSAQAAALIVDQPAPSSGRLADGSFHAVLPVPGQASQYNVEVSNDLLNWVPMGMNNPQLGTIQYIDPDANAWPWRFYRVVPGTP